MISSLFLALVVELYSEFCDIPKMKLENVKMAYQQVWTRSAFSNIPVLIGSRAVLLAEMMKALQSVKDCSISKIGPYKSIPNTHAINLYAAHFTKMRVKALEMKKSNSAPREKTGRNVGVQCDFVA